MSDDFRTQMEHWLERQQAYWQELAAGAAPGETPESWQHLFQEYRQSILQGLPEQQAHLASLLAGQSALFNRYGEQILTALKSPSPATQLEEAIERLVAELQQQASTEMLRQWQLPEEILALFRSHSFQDELLFDNPFVAGFKSLLDTPVVGSSQQLQHQAREGMRRLLAFQEALRPFAAQQAAINQQAGKALAEMLTGDLEIDSLADLHALWVDCYESAYAETAFSESYQKTHSDVSNALMRLRQFGQDWRDSHFEAAGLATRQSLNTILERQHALRREVRDLKRELGRLRSAAEKPTQDTELQALRDEIAQMRGEIDTLKRRRSRPQTGHR